MRGWTTSSGGASPVGLGDGRHAVGADGDGREPGGGLTASPVAVVGMVVADMMSNTTIVQTPPPPDWFVADHHPAADRLADETGRHDGEEVLPGRR